MRVIRLEQERIEKTKIAKIEENVSLALWRIDSLVAPLVAVENARPFQGFGLPLENWQVQQRESLKLDNRYFTLELASEEPTNKKERVQTVRVLDGDVPAKLRDARETSRLITMLPKPTIRLSEFPTLQFGSPSPNPNWSYYTSSGKTASSPKQQDKYSGKGKIVQSKSEYEVRQNTINRAMSSFNSANTMNPQNPYQQQYRQTPAVYYNGYNNPPSTPTNSNSGYYLPNPPATIPAASYPVGGQQVTTPQSQPQPQPTVQPASPVTTTPTTPSPSPSSPPAPAANEGAFSPPLLLPAFLCQVGTSVENENTGNEPPDSEPPQSEEPRAQSEEPPVEAPSVRPAPASAPNQAANTYRSGQRAQYDTNDQQGNAQRVVYPSPPQTSLPQVAAQAPRAPSYHPGQVAPNSSYNTYSNPYQYQTSAPVQPSPYGGQQQSANFSPYYPPQQAAAPLVPQANLSAQQPFPMPAAMQQMASTLPAAEEGVWAPMRPFCLDGQLLLLRRVQLRGHSLLQGCVLDWSCLARSLEQEVADLLPNAHLVLDDKKNAPGRMLASLPVRLEPGSLPKVDLDQFRATFTPVLMSVTVAFGCVLLSIGAFAVLLHGMIRLGRRRSEFVTAVTHELRTPLTTFRMYSEMLVEGMVEENSQKSYLQTLESEADRLTHLVENVLSSARLERGRHAGRLEMIPIGELITPIASRLAKRCERAGMDLRVTISQEVNGTSVRTNPSAVEQILWNLVDNACKYAVTAEDRTIRLACDIQERTMTIIVADSGPGIPRDVRKRLFCGFSKTASEAARTAPGVGLGLALSRRLARDLGGELELIPADRGACFHLTLKLD